MNRKGGSLPAWAGIAAIAVVVLVLAIVGYRMLAAPAPSNKVTLIGPQTMSQAYAGRGGGPGQGASGAQRPGGTGGR